MGVFAAFCGGASLLLLNPSKYIDNIKSDLQKEQQQLEFIKNQGVIKTLVLYQKYQNLVF